MFDKHALTCDSTRVAVEYGENVAIMADTVRRVNFVYWRGSLYYGEPIALVPMLPTETEVKWFEARWNVHFADCEGKAACVDFDDLFKAFNFADEHAERLLRNALLARGIVEEGALK